MLSPCVNDLSLCEVKFTFVEVHGLASELTFMYFLKLQVDETFSFEIKVITITDFKISGINLTGLMNETESVGTAQNINLEIIPVIREYSIARSTHTIITVSMPAMNLYPVTIVLSVLNQNSNSITIGFRSPQIVDGESLRNFIDTTSGKPGFGVGNETGGGLMVKHISEDMANVKLLLITWRRKSYQLLELLMKTMNWFIK